MEFEVGQLRALEAAVAHGTFEAAARALHVTPSAISQRLRALEVQTGRVLLVRSKPIRPTPAGESVLRLARQVALLADETAAQLGGEARGGVGAGGGSDADGGDAYVRPTTLVVAVNADSLATWVLPALAPLADEICFHLRREDEGRTSDLLRSGEAIAAISSDPQPVPGCVVRPLGSMRYAPVATQAFVDRWFAAALRADGGAGRSDARREPGRGGAVGEPGRGGELGGPGVGGAFAEALRRAPMVVFDREDPLQHRWLRPIAGDDADPPSHMIPASTEYAAAIRAGMGWGMLPAAQLGDLGAAKGSPGTSDPAVTGRATATRETSDPAVTGGAIATRETSDPAALVELVAGAHIDVPLFWQQARLRTPSLDRLTDAVTAAARSALRAPD